ncbi:MAG: tRNA (adenosine(37)-N6)-threonylcarbamoyltransferase complex transferase subunit TsaD [Candidatus Dadabacteria bacterium]|nr:tRNA (adenosine(37)-N6)-threonylcarbamoyltransferase complex transferase subunit TsaD [Candidatus Dadabacteria bacterium]NIQ13422.1 tRNA (adenosine(37)-N6)-threonylcarbamoyltransferase complex transferase subunit TsaD [Candidatus Dadabacteria bacterium]
MDTFILGIETSCDETSAAVVQNGNHILSNIISSQIDIHNIYGGVVPEIASRMHTEIILQVINEALSKSKKTLEDIDSIAVTQGPGLIGSLMVGISTAKSLAYSLNKPLVGVNHLEAHISAVHLENDIDFPFIALIVSGGHTNIYYVKDYLEFELLSNTRDDAAGEAFDKAAKVLNLGYPGGIAIDNLAKEGNPKKIKFPRPLNDDSLEFSFSGIKTSLINYLNNNMINNEQDLKDICASYQEAIVETLINKTVNAVKKYKVKNIVISGGVACNSRLRVLAKDKFEDKNIKVFIPSPVLCTDNAAMIAALGYYLFRNNITSDLNMSPYSTAKINPRSYNS